MSGCESCRISAANSSVIPAKAGIQYARIHRWNSGYWVPAFAGMTPRLARRAGNTSWPFATNQASYLGSSRTEHPMNPNSSLIDRAGLDRVHVGKLIDRGLEGADDGELFLEYKQSEMLVFDNGRLKQATYDTNQGFGLRAVKDEAVGYAHASDVSEGAIARAADAVRAVKGGHSGSFAAAPARTNRKLYGDENPLGSAGLRRQGEAAGDDRRLCARQGPARAAGDGEPRRVVAGGRDRAPRRRDLSRHPSAGARQRLRGGRLRRPAGIRLVRLRRPRGLSALHRHRSPGSTPSTRRCARRWSISNSIPAPGRRDGRGARRRLARRHAARGGRPRPRRRLQPQGDRRRSPA